MSLSVRAALTIAIPLCAAFITAGCASTGFKAMGDTKIATVPVGETTFSMSPQLFHLSDNSFMMLRNPAETEMRIEKYDATPKLLWSTPITIAPPNSSIPLFFNSKKWEHPVNILQRKNHLILITSRQDDNYITHITGRTIDPATGAVTRTVTIDSMAEQPFIDEKYQGYTMFTELDSSRIIIGGYVFDRDSKTYGMRITRIDNDLTNPMTKTIPLRDEAEIGWGRRLWFTSDNTLNSLFRITPDSLMLAQYDFTTGALTRSISTMYADPSNSSAKAGPPIVYPSAHGKVVIVAPLADGDDILGAISTQVDPERMEFLQPKVYTIPEEKMKAMVDDDEYSDATFHTALIPGSEQGQCVLAFEQMVFGIGSRRAFSGYQRSVIDYHTGNALLMGFDHDGQARWQQGIKKSSYWATISANTMYNMAIDYSMAVDTISSGTMRIVYRNGGALDLVDYRLNDGAEVPGSHRQLLDMGAGAFVLSGSVMWLDATTMAFVLGQGISSPDWSIGTIRTK